MSFMPWMLGKSHENSLPIHVRCANHLCRETQLWFDSIYCRRTMKRVDPTKCEFWQYIITGIKVFRDEGSVDCKHINGCRNILNNIWYGSYIRVIIARPNHHLGSSQVLASHYSFLLTSCCLLVCPFLLKLNENSMKSMIELQCLQTVINEKQRRSILKK